MLEALGEMHLSLAISVSYASSNNRTEVAEGNTGAHPRTHQGDFGKSSLEGLKENFNPVCLSISRIT